MKYQVIRPNTSIKVGKKIYKTDDVFEAKKEDVKALLEANYIKEARNGKATDK